MALGHIGHVYIKESVRSTFLLLIVRGRTRHRHPAESIKITSRFMDYLSSIETEFHILPKCSAYDADQSEICFICSICSSHDYKSTNPLLLKSLQIIKTDVTRSYLKNLSMPLIQMTVICWLSASDRFT